MFKRTSEMDVLMLVALYLIGVLNGIIIMWLR